MVPSAPPCTTFGASCAARPDVADCGVKATSAASAGYIVTSAERMREASEKIAECLARLNGDAKPCTIEESKETLAHGSLAEALPSVNSQ